ncbi:MAG: phage holin family protein [Deltaproteobacteria bacterium]|nr:phage holin family protein [Deltaproteobacteria bacterium]
MDDATEPASAEPRRADGDDSADGLGGVGRLLRAFGTLLGVHVEHAREEASSDVRRVREALVFALLAAIVGACGIVVLHLALILELRVRFGIASVEAMLVVVGIDAIVCGLLVGRARSRLARPMMAKTRALVRRTVASLTEP